MTHQVTHHSQVTIINAHIYHIMLNLYSWKISPLERLIETCPLT